MVPIAPLIRFRIDKQLGICFLIFCVHSSKNFVMTTIGCYKHPVKSASSIIDLRFILKS